MSSCQLELQRVESEYAFTNVNYPVSKETRFKRTYDPVDGEMGDGCSYLRDGVIAWSHIPDRSGLCSTRQGSSSCWQHRDFIR